MDAAVQEAKLLRQVNALIVAHLRDQNLTQAAAAVAAATMTPVSAAKDAAAALPNYLLRLVAKGLAVEQEEAARGGGAPAAFDSAAAAGSGGLGRSPGTNAVDFRMLGALPRASPSMRPGTSLIIRMLPDVQNLVLMGDILQLEVATHRLSSLRLRKSSRRC